MNERLQKNAIEYKNYLFIAMLVGITILYSVFFMRFTSYDFQEHNKVAEWIKQGNYSMEDAKNANIYLHILSYPFYHALVAFISLLLRIDIHTAMSILLTIVNVGMIVAVRFCMRYIIETDDIRYKYLIDVISCTSTVFVNAVSPLNEYRYYASQGAANPIHNPTIMMVKPFGILLLLIFFKLFRQYQKKQYEIKEYVFFSGVSMISCIAKPSLLMVILPAMGIIVLREIICNKAIKLAIYMFLSVCPSLVVLAMQYLFVNAHSETLVTQIVVGGFSGFTIPEIVLCCLTSFPVVILAFSREIFKKEVMYQIALLTLLVGWCQMFFLSQGPEGNYGWGYFIGIQIATVVSLAYSMKYNYHKIRKIIIWMVYGYQVICGFRYIDVAYHNMIFWF